MDPELKAALAGVNTAVTSMRAEIDVLKKPVGRTGLDVVQREKINRINASAGRAQDVLDRARRASANAKSALARIQAKRAAGPSALDRIRAARAERPSGAGGRATAAGALNSRQPRISRVLPCDWFARGLNQFNGKPLTGEQIQAREEYADKFFGWARTGKGDVDLGHLAPKAAYMQTQDDAKGGFFVTDEMESSIITLSTNYSAVRGLVDVRTITRPSLKQPANMQGATAGWVGETASRTETNNDDAAMLQWFLMEQYAMPKISNILLQDADIDMDAWLNDGLSRAFATNEGTAWITGNGTNAPHGFLSYTMVANASWAWGKFGYLVSGVAAALTDGTHNGVDALIDVISGTKRPYLPNATWLMNRLTQSVVRKLKDTTGQYIWQQSISLDQPSTLLGYPVETDDNMPDIGANAYPIAFGDWRQAYRIVERAGTAMLRDEYTEKGFTKYYTTRRVGGGAKNFEALKFVKISA